MNPRAANPPENGAVWLRAWKPPIDGIREVLHARFAEHAYPPHAHDVWTLFIVDAGAIRYDLERRALHAAPDMVSVLPPHVVHDGRPAVPAGYRKRVVYVETSVLGEGHIGAAVDRPFVADPVLRRRVSALHDALACADDTLDAETRFVFVAEELRSLLSGVPAVPGAAEPRVDDARRDALAEGLRSVIDRSLVETPSLARAALELGAGPTAVARAFRSAFGITPHAYLLGRRLEAARARILDGQPLADVAAETGFYDQAHLTRRFKRFLGTTPGRFRRA